MDDEAFWLEAAQGADAAEQAAACRSAAAHGGAPHGISAGGLGGRGDAWQLLQQNQRAAQSSAPQQRGAPVQQPSNPQYQPPMHGGTFGGAGTPSPWGGGGIAVISGDGGGQQANQSGGWAAPGWGMQAEPPQRHQNELCQSHRQHQHQRQQHPAWPQQTYQGAPQVPQQQDVQQNIQPPPPQQQLGGVPHGHVQQPQHSQGPVAFLHQRRPPQSVQQISRDDCLQQQQAMAPQPQKQQAMAPQPQPAVTLAQHQRTPARAQSRLPAQPQQQPPQQGGEGRAAEPTRQPQLVTISRPRPEGGRQRTLAGAWGGNVQVGTGAVVTAALPPPVRHTDAGGRSHANSGTANAEEFSVTLSGRQAGVDGRKADRKDRPKPDPVEIKTWQYPTYPPRREYQFEMVASALFENTMICLPTGLGKTLIAGVVMANFYRWYPQGIIIFLAATKPLVDQQMRAVQAAVGFDPAHVVQMTGSSGPSAKRRALWQTKRVVFATPQCVEKDIMNASCPQERVVCVVVDEAHHASGKYAFVNVVESLSKANIKARIVALTATPGHDGRKIQGVIDNCMIGKVECRLDDDPDVAQYTHHREVELLVVPTDKSLAQLDEILYEVAREPFSRLRAERLYFVDTMSEVTRAGVWKAMQQFQEGGRGGGRQATAAFLIQIFHRALTWASAIEKYRTHGARELYGTLQKYEGGKTTKHMQYLAKNLLFTELMDMLRRAMKNGASHPKVAHTVRLVREHVETSKGNGGQCSGVLVFTNYRESVKDIVTALNVIEGVRAAEFVGQGEDSSGMRGMTQPEQQEVLNMFRQGRVQVLVATQVAEEGLDIPQVDLIICFDASANPTRSVQRMGRTGRARDGRVVILASEGKEEKTFHQMEQSKNRIARALKAAGGGGMFAFYRHSPRMIPSDVTPTLEVVDMRRADTTNPSGGTAAAQRAPSTAASSARHSRPPASAASKEKPPELTAADVQLLQEHGLGGALEEGLPRHGGLSMTAWPSRQRKLTARHGDMPHSWASKAFVHAMRQLEWPSGTADVPTEPQALADRAPMAHDQAVASSGAHVIVIEDSQPLHCAEEHESPQGMDAPAFTDGGPQLQPQLPQTSPATPATPAQPPPELFSSAFGGMPLFGVAPNGELTIAMPPEGAFDFPLDAAAEQAAATSLGQRAQPATPKGSNSGCPSGSDADPSHVPESPANVGAPPPAPATAAVCAQLAVTIDTGAHISEQPFARTTSPTEARPTAPTAGPRSSPASSPPAAPPRSPLPASPIDRLSPVVAADVPSAMTPATATLPGATAPMRADLAEEGNPASAHKDSFTLDVDGGDFGLGFSPLSVPPDAVAETQRTDEPGPGPVQAETAPRSTPAETPVHAPARAGPAVSEVSTLPPTPSDHPPRMGQGLCVKPGADRARVRTPLAPHAVNTQKGANSLPSEDPSRRLSCGRQSLGEDEWDAFAAATAGPSQPPRRNLRRLKRKVRDSTGGSQPREAAAPAPQSAERTPARVQKRTRRLRRIQEGSGGPAGPSRTARRTAGRPRNGGVFVDDAADAESEDEGDYDAEDLDGDLEGFVCTDRTPSQHGPSDGRLSTGGDDMAIYRQGLMHDSGGVPRHMMHMARGGVLDRLFHGQAITPTQPSDERTPTMCTGTGSTPRGGHSDLHTPQELTYDQNDDVCAGCGEEGDLVCCDFCPAAWHVGCLEGDALTASQLPEMWQCPACLPASAAKAGTSPPPANRGADAVRGAGGRVQQHVAGSARVAAADGAPGTATSIPSERDAPAAAGASAPGTRVAAGEADAVVAPSSSEDDDEDEGPSQNWEVASQVTYVSSQVEASPTQESDATQDEFATHDDFDFDDTFAGASFDHF